MTITTLIPAFKPTYLHELLTGLSVQSVRPERVVISDDSPDQVFSALLASEPFQALSRGLRVEVIPGPRLGAFANCQHLLKYWDGATPLAHMLMDDDVIYPDFYAAHGAAHGSGQFECTVSRRWTASPSGQPIGQLRRPEVLASRPDRVTPVDAALLFGKTIPEYNNWLGEMSNAVFSRTITPLFLEPQIGGVSFIGLGDIGFFLSASCRAPLGYIDTPLSFFRVNAEQSSNRLHSHDFKLAVLGWVALALGALRTGQLQAAQARQCYLNIKALVDERYQDAQEMRDFSERLSALIQGKAQAEDQFIEAWHAFIPGKPPTPERSQDVGAGALDAREKRTVQVDEAPLPAELGAMSVSANDRQYDAWARRRDRGERPAASVPRLRLGVHVHLPPGQHMALKETLVSLQQQWRLPDHEAAFDLSGSAPEALWTEGDGWTLLLAAGDQLEPDALYCIEQRLLTADLGGCRVLYCDHDELGQDAVLCKPAFKPAPNLDLLLSSPYIGRVLVVRTDWAAAVVGPGPHSPWTLAYTLALAAWRESGAAGLLHLPTALVHQSAATVPTWVDDTETWQHLAQVLREHLERAEPGSQVMEGPAPGTFHVIAPLSQTPVVSIIIPTRDQLPLLSRCVETVLSKTDYPAFEVLIVDNGSEQADALAFLAGIEAMKSEQLRVIRAPGPFNFSKMNNQAVAQARGELLLLLNNDTAALQADWLQHMVRHALRPGVGIVGARLLFPDGRVQHAGVVMGLRGPADHVAIGLQPTEPGYMFRAQLTQDFSVVTAACLLVPKALYESLGGLDESEFGVSYNDVDFCLRVVAAGHRVVWTPLATLLHEGSASQKADVDGLTLEQKVQRYSREQAALYQRWPKIIADDPAYNPNLSLIERGYEVELNPMLRPDPARGSLPHHVVAFAADPYGCGHYRILQPMAAMLDARLCSGGASPELFGPNLALRSGADTLVFQRPTSDKDQDLLEALLCLPGVRKVYEIDDELSALPIKSAHRAHMPTDIRARMLRSIGLCDRLVVSTEPLAERLRRANDDIRVVPNRLPPAMWGENAPVRKAREGQRRKPVVGWAGGVGHQGDLALITQLVRDTCDQIDWVFFGMCPDEIRDCVRSFHPGVPTLAYPQQLMQLTQDWDLAVAPLEINTFNECKSNLRLLEYGWCGVPVVCTDVVPYQGDLPVTRVKNRYKDWRNAVLQTVAEPDALRRDGLFLQQRVASDWVLRGPHLEDWYRAWAEN